MALNFTIFYIKVALNLKVECYEMEAVMEAQWDHGKCSPVRIHTQLVAVCVPTEPRSQSFWGNEFA